MDNKEAALYYASIGWHVLPVHYIRGVTCSCGDLGCDSPGKHPFSRFAPSGLKDATIDQYVISKWFDDVPTLNIGIRTGEISGIVVIDVDDLEGKIGRDFPETVKQQTGSGGEHYIYRHPGKHVANSVKPALGLDSRGDGGYIVVEPSNHISGDSYRWVNHPEDTELAEVPQWWLQLLEHKERKSVSPEKILNIGEGERNNALFHYGVRAWKNQVMDSVILEALLKAYNQRACKPPVDDAEVEKVARSIAVNCDGMSVEDMIAIHRAGDEAKIILQSHHKKIAMELMQHATKDPGEPPEFMPKSGLIRDIAQYILSQSEWPMPRLAVAAATCFVGALAGRKFQTWSKLGTNVMMITLADSGSGKNIPRSKIVDIADSCGLNHLMGADNLASAPGLLAEMKESPTKMFSFDEFGIMLQSITNPKSSTTKREIMGEIMKLYSNFGSVYNGTAYADQKARPKVIIRNPCLVIYGTSVPSHFYNALTSEHGGDGFISRMLVMPGEEFRSVHADPEYRAVSGEIRAKVIELAACQFIDDNGVEGPWTVATSKEIRDAFRDLDDSLTPLMTTSQERSIYSRVKENAIKLALVSAVSKNWGNPEITWEDFTWATDIALWCANYIMAMMEEHVADNEHERTSKTMISIVKNAGKDGISKRALLRKFRGMKAFERDELLNDLCSLGDIFIEDQHVFHMKFYRREE